MNVYHPKETLILEETVIRRERVLPPNAFGHAAVRIGEAVHPNKTVAQGELQQDFRIIDVAGPLGIDPADEAALREILTVEAGDAVQQGQPLAQAQRRRDRKRVPLAPAAGSVSLVEDGRVIIQINPAPVEVKARMPGTVTDQLGERGAIIETHGALIQCAWGNGYFSYSSFAFEPEDGLAAYLDRDALLENLRGRVFVLERPLTPRDIEVAVRLRIDGLVAPTMPHYLIEAAQAAKMPILVTDGFGTRRSTDRIFRILRKHERRGQAVFDAQTPQRFTDDRPEIIIPLGTAGNYTPPPPAINIRLRVGMTVRLKRAPYEGGLGEIVDLPATPQVIDNGLRTFVARVKLESGNQVMVPVANVELLGQR